MITVMMPSVSSASTAAVAVLIAVVNEGTAQRRAKAVLDAPRRM
jgi:hypothetical protein